jgi:hypothetical protein
MRAIFGLGLGLKVWNRNSTKTHTFVFGISDLDLTIMGKGDTSFSFLRSSLCLFKRLFIFLGETNYYDRKDLPFIIRRINPYELKRDPSLKEQGHDGKIETAAEKFIFIQRMLFSDIFSLTDFPELRQSKWRHHFDLVGLPQVDKVINSTTVTNALNELAGFNPRIRLSIDMWINQVFKKDFNPYRSSLGEGFRILAPHLHLWYEEGDEREFLQSLNAFERDVIKGQIDWEFWGLYTQRYYSAGPKVRTHLLRLLKPLYQLSSIEADALRSEIDLVFEHG